MRTGEGLVRIGLAGVGYWGPNLLRNFVQVRRCSVEAACDLRDDRLEYVRDHYPWVRTTKRIEDLLASPDLDAVVLATDPPTHHAFARAALGAGKHVLVEKPLAMRAEECRELIRLAAARRLVLMVGHTFEYNAAVGQVKRYLDEGLLGEVYYAYAQRLNLGLVRSNTDVVWSLAPHDLSILNYWFGVPPETVSARGLSFLQPEARIADVAYLLLSYPGGRFAHVHLSWLDPNKVRQMTVVGSKKMLVYDDVSASEKIRIYDKGVTRKNLSHLDGYDDFGKFQLIHRAGDLLIPKLEFEEPLKLECEDFVRCVKEGGTPRSDGRSGLRVVRVLEAASRSMADGGAPATIDWDPGDL
ncbi:MAG: Gfo/Idh/MocA family oxidoreductase [Planctomycetes bacterium]|nr:Gfo/Idh/MocA family oxidoreductase [Planctomycetota bacterium]